MATNYPNQIDDTSTLPIVTDNVNRVSADVINRLRAAILAIESELGVKPSGIYGTIANRLDVIETLIVSVVDGISSGGTFIAGGDLSGTSASQSVIGLQGRPFTSTAPSIGQFIGWTGSTWAPSSITEDQVQSLLSTNDLSLSLGPIHIRKGQVQTTDATPTLIPNASWTLAPGTTAEIDCVITATLRTTGADCGRWKFSGFYNIVGGIAALIGTLESGTPQTTTGAASWAPTLAPNGADSVVVSAVGAAVTNINWVVELRIQEGLPT